MLLYPDYAATSADHGVEPLHDQQIAGLIMWVPAFILTLVGIGLFAAWLGEARRRERWQGQVAGATDDAVAEGANRAQVSSGR